MNETRYLELLGRVLDDELQSVEAEELTAWLRDNPRTRSNLQRHLYLWELFAQQRLAERSADAFVAACQTRMQAEADAQSFVERTERRLQATTEHKPSRRARISIADFIRRLVPRPAWVVAFAALGLIVGSSVWNLAPDSSLPILAMGSPNAVVVERGGQPINSTNGLRLQSGDVLRTPDNANGTISFAPENTGITIQPSAELKLDSLSRGKRFALRTGKIEASVVRQRPFRPMVIVTPQAEARVLGTHFTLAADTNATTLEVIQGKVKFTRASDGKVMKVGAGHYTVAAQNYELVALPQTGRVLREIWAGIPGGEVNDLLDHPHYPNRPAHRDFLKAFETPIIETNNYACRLIGYIHPPVTGEYTFWIASGGYSALWLSRNENPIDKVRIATAPGGLPRQWWDGSSQQHKLMMPQSPKIPLVAGQRYFIQAVEKAATNSSHLEVAWKIPGAEREIISGEFLSPFKPKN